MREKLIMGAIGCILLAVRWWTLVHLLWLNATKYWSDIDRIRRSDEGTLEINLCKKITCKQLLWDPNIDILLRHLKHCRK